MAVSLVFSQDNRYSRSYSDESEALSTILEKRYDTRGSAFILPSGMNAIGTILNVLAPKNDFILYSSELYCDTPKVIWNVTRV